MSLKPGAGEPGENPGRTERILSIERQLLTAGRLFALAAASLGRQAAQKRSFQPLDETRGPRWSPGMRVPADRRAGLRRFLLAEVG